MKHALLILMFSLAVCSAVNAAADPMFAEGNRAYAADDFRGAIDRYEQLVKGGRRNAALFYNLGNALYRAGDFGHAVLNYERALALEPRHPEAAANLRVARDEARALEIAPAGFERYVSFATGRQFTIAAAVALWVALFAGVAALFATRRSALRTITIIVCIAIGAFAGFAAYALETGSHGRGLAVVTAKNIDARVATADNANRVLALPEGSEVTLLTPRGDWVYAGLPNGQLGWIPASAVEAVRL